MAETKILDHPELGKLKGSVDVPGVTTFKNVQYGSLPYGRFTQCVVRESLANSGEVYDATKFGPIAPQPLHTIEFEFGLFQSKLNYDYIYNDEFNSCHLTLALPQKPSVDPEGYPVMVWFSGGGFIIGSAAWPQYNPTKMAAVANDAGKPTIIITVNYRVSIFGNLASKDLVEDAKSHGQEGYGNQGLRDQQTALKWVQNFIKGFGGDPKRVLIFGESAGSASVNAHMVSPGSAKLFSRAILESGTITMVSAFPLEAQEGLYDQVLRTFDINAETAKERVAALRKLSLDEIFAKLPFTFPSRPTCDGYFLDWVPTFADIEDKNPRLFPEWMEAVMFGCTKDDGSIFGVTLKEKSMELITDLTQKALDDEAATHLLNTFKISTANDSQETLDTATKFFTVNGFVRPAIDYAKAWPNPEKVHLFTFNQGNPFDGPFKGKATHTVDALYQFQTMADQFPSQVDKDIGVDFAVALVDFAHGRENVPTFGKEERVKVWGPDGKPGRVMTMAQDPLGLNKELDVVRELGVMKVWGIMGGYLMAP